MSPRGEKSRSDFNGHVDEGKRGDEEVLSRNAEGKMVAAGDVMVE